MKDEKLILNARKPKGELGSQLLDRMNESHENLAIWGAGHLDIKETDYILDIGCGGGVNIERFAKIATSGKVCGIDYSEVSVDKSRKLNKKAIDEGIVEVQEASVSDLPYEDNTFDIITAFETVYFWEDFLKDLKEIRRVLKPGGSFLICNEAYISREYPEEYHKKFIDILDMKVYSEDEFKDYLLKADFVNIEMDTRDEWICVISSKN
ncbi:MAG: class I SAM-dependent methyltransferase [Methanobacteriaceae archaeon]|jgi:ubiquinone/menaquinone biosynthesis C-methylase UbiE|nr:class I SAM-dependent methyltransferase [Methanobacteriaceae archaeon]